jgi:hypothetical protein
MSSFKRIPVIGTARQTNIARLSPMAGLGRILHWQRPNMVNVFSRPHKRPLPLICLGFLRKASRRLDTPFAVYLVH